MRSTTGIPILSLLTQSHSRGVLSIFWETYWLTPPPRSRVQCFEYKGGGLTAETKEKFAELIGQRYSIWFASRLGSWDGERGVYDPYFAHPYPEQPRLSFGAAAQEYGMRELQTRFPEASEAALKEMLLLPLEMLESGLKSLAPPPSKAFMDLVQQAALKEHASSSPTSMRSQGKTVRH